GRAQSPSNTAPSVSFTSVSPTSQAIPRFVSVLFANFCSDSRDSHRVERSVCPFQIGTVTPSGRSWTNGTRGAYRQLQTRAASLENLTPAGSCTSNARERESLGLLASDGSR